MDNRSQSSTHKKFHNNWFIANKESEEIVDSIQISLKNETPVRERGGGARQFYLLNNPPSAIKIETLTSIGKKLRYRFGRDLFTCEFNNHLKLKKAGIRVAEVFAYGKINNTVYLIMEKIKHPQTYLQAFINNPDKTMDSLSDFIIDLAHKGYMQEDANTGNYILDEDNNWWLVDLRHICISDEISKSKTQQHLASIAGWLLANNIQYAAIKQWLSVSFEKTNSLTGDDLSNFDAIEYATTIASSLKSRKKQISI